MNWISIIIDPLCCRRKKSVEYFNNAQAFFGDALFLNVPMTMPKLNFVFHLSLTFFTKTAK